MRISSEEGVPSLERTQPMRRHDKECRKMSMRRHTMSEMQVDSDSPIERVRKEHQLIELSKSTALIWR